MNDIIRYSSNHFYDDRGFFLPIRIQIEKPSQINYSHNFKGTIRAILGNADLDHMEYIDVKDKFKSIKLDESVSSFVIEGKEVLIVHSPDNYEPHLSRDNLKYIFYGHTHKPWQEVKNGKLIINPGNVSNYGYSPTFAVWETDNDKFDLVQLNTIK